MGTRTYDKVLELAAGVYPHKDKKSYVFTQTASGRKRKRSECKDRRMVIHIHA